MLADSSTLTGNDPQCDAADEHGRPIDILPFAAWHLNELRLQPEQWDTAPQLTPEYGRALEQAGGGFSAFEGLECIGAAGIVVLWPGRAQVWALMTPRMRARQGYISRVVRRHIKQCTVKRLECIIDPMFIASVAWATWLGFRYESTMPYYGVDGRTMDMYVRILEG
jgi:RimJ/RimL family protein N-acetyltransferase